MSALAWLLAGGLTMYGMAVGVATEMRAYPGGPEALAASIGAGAEAMRALRWPAERLDTLGGYLTYHNVILFNFFLALYGAVLGARVVRGGEERHSLEEVLATGRSRLAVVRDRTLGVLALMAPIALVLGLGTAVGLATEGEPNTVGALITLGTTGLVGMVGYGLGLVMSQLTRSARAGAGLSAGVLSALYVLTNLSGELGPLGVVRFGSPFFWALRSRALLPGGGADLVGTLVLVAMAAGLVALAALAFERRDYGAPLYARRQRNGGRAGHLPTPVLSWPGRAGECRRQAVWTATLWKGRWGLLAWALGAAGLTALMGWLEPVVLKVWDEFTFLEGLTGGPGIAPERAYWSFAGELLTPVIAAWVIVQASGWVTELAQGRVELLLSAPLSWTRLVLERLVAVVVGVGLISAAALGGLVLGGLGGASALPDAAGLGRLWVTSLLLGAALGAVGALAVAAVRRGAVVTVIGLLIGASYLLAWFVPLFGWPDWLNRLSVFWAFGHPYLEWPRASALLVLVGLGAVGTVVASLIAERTPKVA